MAEPELGLQLRTAQLVEWVAPGWAQGFLLVGLSPGSSRSCQVWPPCLLVLYVHLLPGDRDPSEEQLPLWPAAVVGTGALPPLPKGPGCPCPGDSPAPVQSAGPRAP